MLCFYWFSKPFNADRGSEIYRVELHPCSGIPCCLVVLGGWIVLTVAGFVIYLEKKNVALMTLLSGPWISETEFHLLQFVVVCQSTSSWSFYFAGFLELLDCICCNLLKKFGKIQYNSAPLFNVQYLIACSSFITLLPCKLLTMVHLTYIFISNIYVFPGRDRGCHPCWLDCSYLS